MQQTLHVGSLRVANWTGTDLTMSAPAPPVLRGDATLVGQNLLDVVKAVRGEAPFLEEALLARFEADVPPRSLRRRRAGGAAGDPHGRELRFPPRHDGKGPQGTRDDRPLGALLDHGSQRCRGTQVADPIIQGRQNRSPGGRKPPGPHRRTAPRDPTPPVRPASLRQPKRQSQPHWRRTQAPVARAISRLVRFFRNVFFRTPGF